METATIHERITKKKALDYKNLGLFSWLGWRDSNPRMPVPKTGALPLGDTPIVSMLYMPPQQSVRSYTR